MTLAAYEDRAQLEEIAEAVKAWIAMVREQADAIDEQQVKSLIETTEKAALRLEERLPPSLDPGASNEIRAILIGALRKVKEADESRPLDILDDFLVRAESIRHIIRDALDEDLAVDPTNERAILETLLRWLSRVPKQQIARLLGVDVKTLQRWTSNGRISGRNSRRLWLVAKLVLLLKDAWTPEGVVAWFDRPRHDLNGKKPIDVLDDEAFERALLSAAREGRAQRGA